MPQRCATSALLSPSMRLSRKTVRHLSGSCSTAASSVCRLRRACHCCSRPGSSEATSTRSEEHTSELQSLMRISYAVFCLKKKKLKHHHLQEQKHTIQNYMKHNHIRQIQLITHNYNTI